jgi:rRNA maturation protein Rpf1
MGLNWPKVMITTSRRPAEESRIFGKALQFILPNSFIFTRGDTNEKELHIKAMEQLVDFVYKIYSREQRVDRIAVFQVYEDKLIEVAPQLKIHQYIDHKIFGFPELPERGPISTDLITRTYRKDLIDYFEEYWFLEFNKKNPIWMAIDVVTGRKTTYVALIDALTQKKFFFAEMELINR